MLVRSVRHEGQAVAVALEERAVPYRLVGATAFFQRAEVKDVLAWLRLLVDPSDAGAVVRALARPPIELRSIDLARCVQIARRRKLDMVSALVAATESPQLPPEARERILRFLKLHRSVAAVLDTTRPDLFVHRLIDRLGLRRQGLFTAQADVVERLVSLARLGEMAAGYVRRAPQATPREFAHYAAAVAEAGLREEDGDGDHGHGGSVAVMTMQAARGREFDHVFVLGLESARFPARPPAPQPQADPVPDALLHPERATEGAGASRSGDELRRLLYVALTRARRRLVLAYGARSSRGGLQPPSPLAEEARVALGAQWEDREEELFGPDETLHATFTALRDELLQSVSRVGSRLGELRLDTDLDVAHGVVRHLELLKLTALMARPEGQTVADALPGVNAAILQAATAQQRDILQTSALDDVLIGAEQDARARGAAIAARDEPSLEPFLPTRGDGLLLSASDIETYRTCPLKYKFARVFRIPSEPTLNQRFGILVHQVLERYHQAGPAILAGRAARAAGGGLAAWRLRVQRGGAPASRQGAGRAASATSSACAATTASRCGSRRPSSSASGRTRCAAAWIASTGCPTAATSSSTTRPGGPRPRCSCARTSSSRCTPSGPARPGTSTPRASPTCTCSTTRRCRSRPPTSTASGSPTRCARWPTESSRRASSRRRPTAPARPATSGSPAPPRSADKPPRAPGRF